VRFKAIKREVDTAKHRAVCGTSCVLLKYGMPIPSRVSDFCSSTIFGGYFLCKKCGRDFCLQCERYFSESLETIRDSPWDIPDAARPRLLRCTGGVERIQGKIGSKIATQFHVRPDLQPVSRFDAKELKQQWVALAEFVLRGIESLEQQLQQLGVAEDEAELKKLVEEWMAQRMAQAALERQTQPAVSEEDIAALYQKRTNPAITPISDPAGLEDLSLPFLLIPADRLNNETFDTLWARLRIPSSSALARSYAVGISPSESPFLIVPSVIVDCQTNAFELINIAQFFEMWKNPEGRKSRVLKLKVSIDVRLSIRPC